MLGEYKKQKISKLIAYALRHHPEELKLDMDHHGWVETGTLVHGIQEQYSDFTLDDLEDIVRTDNKKRYSFDETKKHIRANQGHSVPVDVELEQAVPPTVLYHGTAEKAVDAIMQEGIKPMSRLHVHLSADMETARGVGQRHGKPVLFEVQTGQMAEDGYVFFRSANGVWLTKEVPPQYIRRSSFTKDGA